MPRKVSVTLMGMSGVGKSYFSKMLAGWGWRRYSCDEHIGEILLEDTSGDINFLNNFLGKLGDPAKGGLTLEEFKKRQTLYYNAEMVASLNLASECAKADANFVYDSAGSLCEMEDAAVIRHTGENSLIVYIEAAPAHREEVLKRSVLAPKPILFPPSKFDGWVAQYLKENNLNSSDEMDPTAFFAWVFPILFNERLPKYEAIADEYGITISSQDLVKVKNEAEFLELIGAAHGG